MATTTNYGWTTPNDTDLVKDGAAAIRTLGSSVDTTTKALNPSTTLGDLEYRSATANTNTRLGIGTSGQVLSVSGGVPAWVTSSSGGMTLLSTTTLSGATTTISSIDQTYTNLFISVSRVTNASNNGSLRIAPNASTNITTTTRISGGQLDTPQNDYLYLTNTVFDRTAINNVFSLVISNYANTSFYKAFSINGTYYDPNATSKFGVVASGGIETNSAITSLVFSASGGNLSGGTVLIYGVK